MAQGAIISACSKYRYSLWRIWNTNIGYVIFIGLNPSTADAREDDPTIRRCIGFAKNWGFGGIYMLNLFAFRATSPKELKKADNPIGPRNNKFLIGHIKHNGLNIACWGVQGSFMNREKTVIGLLGRNNLSCLGLTQTGHPKHPLYLKKDTKVIGYRRIEQWV